MKYFPFCVYKLASIISVSELCVVINYVFPILLRYQNQNWGFGGGGVFLKWKAVEQDL